MVDKISQNLKYSEGAVLMCWENALSLCERDNKKYTFSMQLTDYQAFTPPPPPPTA
ncbi:MAG: hypothetical protein LBR36_07110 [Bacteroidales bacterium]|nr:hypothetical protein [Bacteroidales bacterium]